MGFWKKIGLMTLAVIVASGCSMPVLKGHVQPSKTKDQFTRIKRVVIFPFENYSESKDVDKTIDALLPAAILDEDVFTEVEDTRFVRDVMKKLKITSTDILDKEVLKKLGDEMNVQGIIYGKVVLFGKGKEKDASPQVTMDMQLVEPSTGNVLWVGNVSAYGGLTAGKIFGVTEGKTDIEVARDAIRKLAGAMASDVVDRRNQESKGLVAELRKEHDREEARLKELKGQTGKVQEDLDKAKNEAKGIRDAAKKEADAQKSDIELQKAAIEAEKAKTDAAQQAIEQDKLKVEMERKKIEEDLKKIEEERKKLAEEAKKAAAEEAKKAAAAPAIKEEAVKEATPAPPPPEVKPAGEVPAPPPPEVKPAGEVPAPPPPEVKPAGEVPAPPPPEAPKQ